MRHTLWKQSQLAFLENALVLLADHGVALLAVVQPHHASQHRIIVGARVPGTLHNKRPLRKSRHWVFATFAAWFIVRGPDASYNLAMTTAT